VESNHWHCTQAVPWLAMSQPFGLGLSPSLSRPKPGPAVLGHDEHCPKTRDSPSVLIPFYHRNDTNQRKSSKSAKVRVGDIPHPRSPETPWGSGKKRPASPYPLALPSLSPHCHACPSCPVPTTSYGHNDQHPRTPPNAGERMIATHPARGADRPPPSGILRATPTTRPSPGHYDQSGRAKNEKTARIRGTSPRIICINMGIRLIGRVRREDAVKAGRFVISLDHHCRSILPDGRSLMPAGIVVVRASWLIVGHEFIS
jgi:hypothetical protein